MKSFYVGNGNGKGKDALPNLGLGNWFFRFQALLLLLFVLFVCQMDPPDRFPMESSPPLSFLLPPLGQIFSPLHAAAFASFSPSQLNGPPNAFSFRSPRCSRSFEMKLFSPEKLHYILGKTYSVSVE